MKSVLITGHAGMLGKEVVAALAKQAKYNIHGIDIRKLCSGSLGIKEHLVDLSSFQELTEIIDDIKPDIILHLAAIVDLALCEKNPQLAKAVHTDAVRIMAMHGAKIIYISTDSVFNGEHGNYSESDVPDPLNYYAQSKLLGEHATLSNSSQNLVIRTNIFGFNIPLKGSLAEWALKELSAHNEMVGYQNVWFNPIYTKHLARIIHELILKETFGVINIGSENVLSKYEFLKYFAHAGGFTDENIITGQIDLFAADIKRPLNTSLDLSYARTIVQLPSTYESIDAMIADYKKKVTNEQI